MCGIAGSFAHDRSASPVSAAELVAIRDSMAARGPDGAGLWIDERASVGLAHRRLSIIDLTDSGAQPMAFAGGRLVIVFNGEIYNFRELRKSLADAGARFISNSDTEVLLHLYERDGVEMLRQLRGMFTFALYDRERDGLFLARDGFGIKPLYYTDDGKTFRFASQVKALLAGGQVDSRPSAAGSVGFFLWGSVPEPWTAFKAIRALPAGHSLWVDRNGPRRPTAFFDLVGELAEGEGAPVALKPGELREMLLDTVAHHLVADVPVGAFLSAGLNSSTLVALASEIETSPIRSVTLAFDEFKGKALDEAPLAETVAAHYATSHTTQRIRAEDFRGDYRRLCAAMDQPSIDGVNTYYVAKATAASGLKVAISGLGADELFAGYSDFGDIPRMVRLGRPFSHVPGLGLGFRFVSAPLLKRFASPKYASLFEFGGNYPGAYLLRRSLFLPWELPQVMDADLAAAGWRQLEEETLLRRDIDRLGKPRLKVTALEAGGYMRNQLLRDSDWAGMAHSLEIRVPFVDTTLLRRLAPALAGTTPPGKADMAATPRKPLPEAIIRRPKTGFSVPVREWLSGAEGVDRGLRGWARQIAADCYN